MTQDVRKSVIGMYVFSTHEGSSIKEVETELKNLRLRNSGRLG